MIPSLLKLAFLCFFIFSVLGCVFSQPERIRFCVPDGVHDDCVRMSDNVPSTISCVKARDKFECMRLIDRDEADIVNTDAEDLYLAGRLFGLEPLAVEEYNGNIYKYKAGVLVPKNSDISSISMLKNRRACLSGFGENSGWNIQIGILLATNTLVPDCRSELHSVEGFFNHSCAPGKWSEDPIVDAELKRRHPNLCSLCKDPQSCSSSDPFAGVQGSIKCLTEGQAQVAFTTVEAAELYFRNRPDERNHYQFLCLDGSRMPITRRACEWAKAPTNTFVMRRGRALQRDIYLRHLQQTFFRFSQLRPSWFARAFVSSENVTQLVTVPFNMLQWDKYLGNYIPSIEKSLPGCERKNLTFCLTSPNELAKCLELQKAAYARRIRPQIRCFNAESRRSCIDAVNNRKADLVTLEEDQFYQAARYENIVPVAVERSDIPDFAVAVVKVQSDILTLNQLKGLRSCHTGFGKISGWKVPVSTFIEEQLIPGQDCNRAREMAQFFAGSCVPGAADARINTNGSGVDKLCSQCIGNENGQHVCEASKSERFYDEEGALRCLVEGRGDVAFLNYRTPLNYVDGKSNVPWSFFLRSADFRLLCRNSNSVATTQARLGQLNEYRDCHLAKISGRVVATTRFIANETRFEALQAIIALSHMFSKKVPMSFKLFGAYKNESNQIFGDNTDSMKAVPFDASYRNVLDGQILKILEDNDGQFCASFSWSIHQISYMFYLLLIVFNILYIS